MFNSKDSNKSSGVFDIIIGSNSEVTGEIKSSGSVRIDGKLTGDIHADGDVILCVGSEAKSNIKCNQLEISGNCTGNVNAKSNVVITGSGSLSGDVTGGSISIKEGASFEGNCQIVPKSKATSANDPIDLKEKKKKQA